MSSRKSAERLVAIDFLRGVAVLAVLCDHLPFSLSATPARAEDAVMARDLAFSPWVYDVASYGQYGVHLFLVISGFCIHMQWARATTDSAPMGFVAFWKRRLHRLYPPYFAALLASLAGLYFLYGVLGAARSAGLAARFGYASSTQLLVDIFLLSVLAQNLNGAAWRIGNGPFWTLALEEQLYLLYFPLLWFRRRYGWSRVLVLVGLLTFVWRVAGMLLVNDTWRGPWMIVGPARWFEWALGALAVEAHLGRVRLPPWCSSASIGFGLLGAAIASHAIPRAMGLARANPVDDPSFGLAFFVLVNAACRANLAGLPQIAVRWFAWVGGFSYSLYLTHQPTIVAAKQFGLRMRLGVPGILLLRAVLALVVAYGFYVLIESRFLNASRRQALATTPAV